jgi:carboxymethylenebutenolidase
MPDDSPMIADIKGMTGNLPLSRRGFMSASAAAAAGYTLAAGPVSAQAIMTDTSGLTAGDIKIGDMPGHGPSRPALPIRR